MSDGAIQQRFAALASAGKRALVPYVTAGHPDPSQLGELLHRGSKTPAPTSSSSGCRFPIRWPMVRSFKRARSARSSSG